MIIVGAIMGVASFIPTGMAASLSYNVGKTLHLLDITVTVISPAITQQVVDANGQALTQITVGAGTRIYTKGTVKDASTQQVAGGVRVHLYAKIGGTYATYTTSCSLTDEPSCAEWNSELTYADGTWDTSKATSFPDGTPNVAEWLEVKSDGIYNKGTTKIWSGDPNSKTLALFATMWAGDGSFSGRTSDVGLPCSAVVCSVPSGYTNYINGELVVQGASYKVTTPTEFKTVPASNPSAVSKVYLEGTFTGSPAQFVKQSDNSWKVQITLPTGTYTVRIKVDTCAQSGTVILSMTHNNDMFDIEGGLLGFPLLLSLSGLFLVAGVITFAVGRRQEG